MITQFWKQRSITTKFMSSFGVLLLLLVLVAITGHLALRDVRNAETIISTNREVHDIVIEIENAMEKARRLHANFFLYYPLIGFAKAQELYAKPSALQLADVTEKSHKLQELLKGTRFYDTFHDTTVNLNLYLSAAKRFADTSTESIALIRELAAPVSGLESVFKECSVALQAEAGPYHRMQPLLEKMLSFSKDYLISRQRFSMQSSFNTLQELRQAVEAAVPDSAPRQKIVRLLDQWEETAGKILQIDVKIRSTFMDFSLQTEATDPAAAALITYAKAAVEQAQSRILRAHRSAIFIMSAIAIFALFLAVIIARILNNTITRNIINLTHSAEEFRLGNLDARAAEEGPDELGQLAGTFNTMADRLRELIDTLEHKVNERTAELTASEKRFRAIVENTTQGILIIDTTTMRFLYANPAIAAMFGYHDPEELLGREITELHPKSEEQIIKTGFFNMVAGKSRFAADIPCLKTNGTIFYADIVSGMVSFADRLCLVAFFLDTTEKRNLRMQLERARKMEAIGLLAGGVAHDLNNILSGIVSYPELLLLQLPPDSALRMPLKAINDSGKRAAAVVSDLLTVARGVASTRETADLNALILDYLASPEHMEMQASHLRITCRKDLDPQVAHISCSPIHIKKCLLNLMMNAMEAIDEEGVITISTRNRSIDREKAESDLRTGRYTVLSLADTGHGIKEEDLEHIFEPFYTKKIMGKSGTGLGLAVVWNSVQDHGGAIRVESSHRGTVFHLFFPATDDQIASKNSKKTLEQLQGDGEAILVVDDEPQQLDISRRILSALHYTPHCVRSGEEAISYMESNSADLILLDMIMDPGINGLQTYEHILRLHPGQKAIIVSGFAESRNVQMAQAIGARGFIKKPYSIEQLGLAIKEELGRERAILPSSSA